MRYGVLFLNLGSPNTPTVGAIRRFLAAFLNDKRVISLPFLVRQLLLYGLILPFRPYKLVAAYQAIWTPQGSPLLSHARDFHAALVARLPNVAIEVAMQHSEPHWKPALVRLLEKNLDKLIILPLYPQYASATTGAVLEEVLGYLKLQTVIPHLEVIRDFYQHPAYIAPLAKKIKEGRAAGSHLLLSYHGLPQRDIEAIEPISAACKTGTACPVMGYTACYRAQCFATTRGVAQVLGLKPEDYTVSFQSRLGRIPWIQPYTDDVLLTLRTQGIVDLTLVCPSFVMDCLETLEEIGMRAKDQWESLGGQRFTLIPCLNSDPEWISAIPEIIGMNLD